jgi:tetratricopeptide (TPR) repeat protein
MTREVEILMQQGKWAEAVTACQALIQQQPVVPKLHGLLGFCYMKLNNFIAAEAAFRKAVTLEPNYWEAGIKLAQCLDRMLKYKEALQVAEFYLPMRPNDPALLALVNGLRRQAGAVEEESWQKNVKKGTFHNVTLSQE